MSRSESPMKNDPYTLFVALDADGTATGELYMDDEVTFSHETRQEFVLATFVATFKGASASIVSSVEVGSGWKTSLDEIALHRMIERIVIMGVSTPPSNVNANGESLGFTFDRDTKVLVCDSPGLAR